MRATATARPITVPLISALPIAVRARRPPTILLPITTNGTVRSASIRSAEWFYPGQIAHRHDVERRALYRHAHATGLYARRDRNLRFALAALIECCHEALVSGDTVVRAVRAYTRVNSEGQWIEPPTRVTVSPGGAFLSSESLTQLAPSMGPARESTIELLPGAGDDSPCAVLKSSSERTGGESDGRARK